MRSATLPWIGVLLLLAVGQPALSGEAYYMAVFGAQRPDVNLPRYSHSFAVFSRVSWCGGPARLEAFTISWFPASAAIRTAALLPEPGRNFDLYTTLRLVQAQGERVSLWGPYQIRRSLYQRALDQKNYLESGSVRYKAVDTGWPEAHVSNCIHAVSDLAEDGPLLRITSPGWGDPASYYITLHLSPWIIEPRVVHEWLFDALGLRNWFIHRRHLSEGNPSQSGLVRAAMSVTQRRLERIQRCMSP
jgi:hypothetical protein